MAGSKILKGSFLIMISFLFFRVGGYIYKLFIARLLGPAGYGLFGATLPFIGIFQILSAAGFPPAIAKFVSQHKALGEEDMARQVIVTATKLMMILGVFFGLVMFFSAGLIASYYGKPDLTLPLQAVSLIMPFSVIVGAFRGAFQGMYKMELIVASRGVEQLFTIILGVALVAIGFYAAGAVLGIGLGFLASALISYILFRKYIWPMFPKKTVKMSFKEELGLLKTLLIFSVPVTITALSEMAIYDVSTFFITFFMAIQFTGFYTSADPIARIPLIISISVATAILPAASEAASLKNKALLDRYVFESYRYVVMTVLPLCVGIALFSQPLITRLFGPEFSPGWPVLSILVIGMTFYSLFMVSSSISQGVGRPRVPMYVLIIGTIINIGLNYLLVPLYGIVGAAIATTLAAFIIMVLVLWQTFKITQVKLPFPEFVKIGIASLIMGLPLLLLPQTYLGLYIAVIISPFIYLFAFAFIGGFTKKDIEIFRRYIHKLGPLSGVVERLITFIERFAK
ncbi:MAG: oligosaccharide flippase family protein [Methanobacterium sp.]